MTRLIKNTILLLLFSFTFQGFGQNLYDLEHSQKFANYLYKTKQYKLAAEEFERVCFLSPDDTASLLKMVRSYRLAGNFSTPLAKIDSFYVDYEGFPTVFAHEYTKNLLLNRDLNKVEEFLTDNKNIETEEKQYYLLGTVLLRKDWTTAGKMLGENACKTEECQSILLIAEESQQLKYKSPALAGFMSTVIPGTGKIYTKNWKDGLISLLLVSANAFQAYRGFSQQGKRSAYGWVFGGLTVAFYSGNVWGSVKAAKKYNSNIDDEIYRKAENTLYSNF